MADWQRELDIVDVWSKCSNCEITIQELSKVIAERIEILEDLNDDFIDREKEIIIEDFFCLSEEKDATEEDFDGVMEILYDWADRQLDDKWNGKKVCWIKTK